MLYDHDWLVVFLQVVHVSNDFFVCDWGPRDGRDRDIPPKAARCHCIYCFVPGVDKDSTQELLTPNQMNILQL